MTTALGGLGSRTLNINILGVGGQIQDWFQTAIADYLTPRYTGPPPDLGDNPIMAYRYLYVRQTGDKAALT